MTAHHPTPPQEAEVYTVYRQFWNTLEQSFTLNAKLHLGGNSVYSHLRTDESLRQRTLVCVTLRL